MKQLTFFQPCLSYENVAWVSTCKTDLGSLYRKKKYAARFIPLSTNENLYYI